MSYQPRVLYRFLPSVHCGPVPVPPARVVEMEDGSLARLAEMPSNRLMTLLQQAVAFQIERGRYHPKARKGVSSFLVTHFFFGGGEAYRASS